MAIGIKKNETRNRATKVRGEIVICAAARKPNENELSDEILKLLWRERKALKPNGYAGLVSVGELLNALPLGKALCIVNLNESFEVDNVIATVGAEEIICGNYSTGRHIWKTEKLQRLENLIAVKGSQGFFFLTDEVECEIVRQLKPRNS